MPMKFNQATYWNINLPEYALLPAGNNLDSFSSRTSKYCINTIKMNPRKISSPTDECGDFILVGTAHTDITP